MAPHPFQNDWRDTPRRIGVGEGNDALLATLGPALDQLGVVVPARERADVTLWTGEGDGLDDLVAAAGGGRTRLVIATPMDALDHWGFAIGLPGVELVPDSDPDGIVRALARRTLRKDVAAAEGEPGDSVKRLHELADEVTRIAQALETVRTEPVVSDRRLSYRADLGDAPAATAATIRAMIRARRVRDQFFAGELFADPAWDILLDLMAARLEGCDVAVSSLCIAAAVPPTTALRWISAMTEQGMLVRVADVDDRRRVFIRLSEETAEGMAACLAAMLRSAPVA